MMSRCKEHKCDGYIFPHGKHKCEPLWDIAYLEDYDDTEDCWMEERGIDEEDAVEKMCSHDGEFYDGTQTYIVRNPETKEKIKVHITAEPSVCYNTTTEKTS